MLVIVDSGVGNIGSLVNMMRKIGAPVQVSSMHEDVEQADKIILPGIGSFDAGMQRLMDLNLIEVLHKKVLQQKTPVLGICLGMQMMAGSSSEGKSEGLNWIKGDVVRFDFSKLNDASLKIPHMGWNFIELKKKSKLFNLIEETPRFYFVHGYYFKESNEADVLGVSQYGFPFTAAIESGNIAGVQFHPEKSHKFGMQLLKNFIDHF